MSAENYAYDRSLTILECLILCILAFPTCYMKFARIKLAFVYKSPVNDHTNSLPSSQSNK